MLVIQMQYSNQVSHGLQKQRHGKKSQNCVFQGKKVLGYKIINTQRDHCLCLTQCTEHQDSKIKYNEHFNFTL